MYDFWYTSREDLHEDLRQRHDNSTHFYSGHVGDNYCSHSQPRRLGEQCMYDVVFASQPFWERDVDVDTGQHSSLCAVSGREWLGFGEWHRWHLYLHRDHRSVFKHLPAGFYGNDYGDA